jgi:hypothetical protein
LCEDLPFLALTCRQILGEMWGKCFSTPPAMTTESTKKTVEEKRDQSTNHIGHVVKVKNFDFLPLFRFLQMLRHLPTRICIQRHMVDVVLKDDNSQDSTSPFKYERVKRLIESQWLEDLPLWGCFTGMRKEVSLKKKSRTNGNESKWKDEAERKAKQEFWK